MGTILGVLECAPKQKENVFLLIEYWGLFLAYRIWGTYFQSQVRYLIKISFKPSEEVKKKKEINLFYCFQIPLLACHFLLFSFIFCYLIASSTDSLPLLIFYLQFYLRTWIFYLTASRSKKLLRELHHLRTGLGCKERSLISEAQSSCNHLFKNCLSAFWLTGHDWRLWGMPLFFFKKTLNLNVLNKSLFVAFLWWDYFLSRNKLDRNGEVTEVWITCDFYGTEQTAKNHWASADPENQGGHNRIINVDFYVKFYLLLLNAFLLTVENYLVKKRLL